MLRAVIFDFDGVITDSEVLHLRSFNHALNQYGLKLETKDYYMNYLGYTDLDCFRTLREQGRLKVTDDQIDELIIQKNLRKDFLANLLKVW